MNYGSMNPRYGPGCNTCIHQSVPTYGADWRTTMTTPDTKELLDAAIRQELHALAAHSRLSAPTLARLTLQLIDDPAAVAAHPIECRILRERRDQQRQVRSARTLHTPLV